MLKTTLVAAAFGLALAAPVYAQDAMTCDEASMTKMETDVGAMSDATKKDSAMKEVDMAKEAMTAQNMDECKTHMENAMKEMQAS